MTTRWTSSLVLAACFVAGAASATTVYKSVDANGNVTYSMTPPPEAVRSKQVDVRTNQPDAGAQSRLATARGEIAASGEASLEREKSLREARAAMAAAKKQLAATRIVQEDDWLGTIGPYRRLKPAYYERVQRAEAAVAAAELAVHRHCEGSGCEQPSWHVNAGTDTVFRPTGSIRHGEAGHVVVGAEGRDSVIEDETRRTAGAVARREVQGADDRREVGDAGARREEQGADDRREVWNAKGRTTVRAGDRREVD